MTSDATPSVPSVLGTPLTDSAVRVLLLGAGELGKELTIAFQRLGVEVIAVDRYEGAPAQQVAHHSAVIDMTDPAAVTRVVKKFKPDFVVPEIEAIATAALIDIESSGLARVIPSAFGADAAMNRERVRRLADEELGIPVPPYLFADSLDELKDAAATIGYPCVVKPIVSSSGKGQTVLSGPADVEKAWEAAKTKARVSNDRVIVEGFIDFDYEVTLLTVRSVDPASGEVITQFCAPIGHRQEDGDYVESWQPQPMEAFAMASATSIAARIATAMCGDVNGRGIFGVELFVKGDDVYFSEVSPRPHDTGLVTLATQRVSEFELHARAILGLPCEVTLASPGASAVIYGDRDEKAVGYANVAAALAVPETSIWLFGKPESTQRRRLGVVTATADDIDEARARATAAAGKVGIVSPPKAKPAPAKKTPARKPAAKKAAPKKPAAKKSATKKTAAKTATKKPAAKKSPAKKSAVSAAAVTAAAVTPAATPAVAKSE
ncbi:MAG: formate-dependent phosphoribosylglycinamide formyltransferase [Gordonia sp. (in: high G+C Gram-positive bacteria)]|uniref:formate-dependent phosphoribosylglycinamide formyltransferase n=1 Tax=Gordonia sp. (in: high G+C Gram-positive bacteria) TaxID=84139 RepID=UPI0039E2FD22